MIPYARFPRIYQTDLQDCSACAFSPNLENNSIFKILRFPNTICEVVKQGLTYQSGHPIKNKCQFSWYCDGKSDKVHEEVPWARALIVADNVLRGKVPDLTKGATHYHARYVNPYWSASLNTTVTYGSHKFYE